jgi:hypothetical protein
MNALLNSAPLLLRRRGAIADLLPVIAFAAASGILAMVLGGYSAFADRAAAVGIGLDFSGAVTEEQSLLSSLQMYALIACVLLIPTAIGLGGSAARLSLSRREKDLAAMRLVGGTTAQVGLVAVVDVAAQALIGTVIGVGLHLAVTPLLTHLDFGIAPFTFGELLLPLWGYPVLLLGVVLLASGSAAVALTGVAMTPLGVAKNARVVRMSVIRLVLWVGALLAFLVLNQLRGLVMQNGGVDAVVIFFAVFMAIVLVSMNIVGPFIIWISAKLVAAIAPTPSLMVGARRLASDPRSGWRAVSGITFGLVIAGFLTLMTLFGSTGDPSADAMTTALHTGGLLTLAIAAVIDQGPVLRSQHISGAQVKQLHRARIAEIAIPLALSSIVAVLTTLVLITPLGANMAANPLPPILQYVGSVLGAYALVIAAVLVASPLVRREALAAA